MLKFNKEGKFIKINGTRIKVSTYFRFLIKLIFNSYVELLIPLFSIEIMESNFWGKAISHLIIMIKNLNKNIIYYLSSINFYLL